MLTIQQTFHTASVHGTPPPPNSTPGEPAKVPILSAESKPRSQGRVWVWVHGMGRRNTDVTLNVLHYEILSIPPPVYLIQLLCGSTSPIVFKKMYEYALKKAFWVWIHAKFESLMRIRLL